MKTVTIDNTDLSFQVNDKATSLRLVETIVDGERYLDLLDDHNEVVCEDQYICSLLEQAGFTSITF